MFGDKKQEVRTHIKAVEVLILAFAGKCCRSSLKIWKK